MDNPTNLPVSFLQEEYSIYDLNLNLKSLEHLESIHFHLQPN
ncbi:hypothetical protein XBKQ1_2610003 [Xenorhabdus bovienii str. kraussei Quebec]|uniref:Uncharacterized protein n=1 Tax=Xenorhabdus bovienii str. kraussei Quebec TaxID=1398203 RepID=A0A077PH29_XENBV|nr:hypothetical protein XBKQ1_2610003 [Xenorhabdus bovienii str. kraussei Quebec]